MHGAGLDEARDKSGQDVVGHGEQREVGLREHLLDRHQRDTRQQRLGAQPREVRDGVRRDHVVTGATERGAEHGTRAAGAHDADAQPRRCVLLGHGRPSVSFRSSRYRTCPASLATRLGCAGASTDGPGVRRRAAAVEPRVAPRRPRPGRLLEHGTRLRRTGCALPHRRTRRHRARSCARGPRARRGHPARPPAAARRRRPRRRSRRAPDRTPGARRRPRCALGCVPSRSTCGRDPRSSTSASRGSPARHLTRCRPTSSACSSRTSSSTRSRSTWSRSTTTAACGSCSSTPTGRRRSDRSSRTWTTSRGSPRGGRSTSRARVPRSGARATSCGRRASRGSHAARRSPSTTRTRVPSVTPVATTAGR